eukprot:740009-Pelagomonas_calceolata.AAC.1
MLGSYSFQSGEGVGMRAGYNFNKMNVPVLGRDLGRIQVGKPAWDRAHEDSIRAALVPGKGASTIRKKTVKNSTGDILRDFCVLLQESFIPTGIHNKGRANKGRAISAFAEGFNTLWQLLAEAKANMVPIRMHPIHCWFKAFKGNVIYAVHFAA